MSMAASVAVLQSTEVKNPAAPTKSGSKKKPMVNLSASKQLVNVY